MFLLHDQIYGSWRPKNSDFLLSFILKLLKFPRDPTIFKGKGVPGDERSGVKK